VDQAYSSNAVGSRAEDESGADKDRRSLVERSKLVLTFARVLYVDGQSTDETLAAANRLGETLGLRSIIIPRWGDLQIQAAQAKQAAAAAVVAVVEASPTGVQMERVARAMRAIDEAAQSTAGGLAMPALRETITAISGAPPAPTWQFTIAAAAGAAALSVLFGVGHLAPVILIVLSAAAGAVLRRIVGRYSSNAFLQPLCASLLAGIVGALAVRYELSSSLRLVAVCPCMILVPGPHVLNGMMDLIAARISLGAARVGFACLVILVISIGLLFGLGLLGVSLPVDGPGREVSLWLDMIAAGVAAGAYSVFFSTPLRMLGWPVAIGMLAHALRWLALSVGGDAATGALVACLIVGVILTPVAHHWRMPFAAIGFASVVSMIPGVLLFRMASGFLQLANNSNTMPSLLPRTISDGVTAVNIILAMSLGVVVPKLLIDRLTGRPAWSKS
jgi:uncharacterized membrane protein YjjB (DUF3815 family)